MLFINLLLEEFWVLGDSVFFRIPKKIKRKNKKNKYLPINNDDAEFQLTLEKCYGYC
jgi:hypothetical protein